MATRKTNRRKYLILATDVARITKLPWSTIAWWIWRSSFKWDKTGKIKKGRSKSKLMPVKGRRYSATAVWDVNDFLNFQPDVFKKLASQNAWTRLRHDLNEFVDD